VTTEAALAPPRADASAKPTRPPVAPARAVSAPARRRFRIKTGYLMVAPYLLHLALFFGYPLVFSLVLVFHHWDVITPMEWAGGANVGRLFSDDLFARSVFNTGIFLGLHIPLQIALALFFAELLNQKLPGRGFFRSIYFLPVVVSGVVVTILFQQLFAFETGYVNGVLAAIGGEKVPWLVSPEWAMPSIALMATWKNAGLYVLLFLAGLQNIPESLYEAAHVEGASRWQRWRWVTLPMLNPMMVTVVVLSTIGGFSLFIEPYVLTGGGPLGSTMSALLYIYNQAFYFGHMGYAATLGLAFALMILVVVALQRRFVETDQSA
jgi:multiple sugar transport system permease protein